MFLRRVHTLTVTQSHTAASGTALLGVRVEPGRNAIHVSSSMTRARPLSEAVLAVSFCVHCLLPALLTGEDFVWPRDI